MEKYARAIIITIGDEILIGQILDTNAQWLCQQLTHLGFEIRKKITIPDNVESIVTEIKSAWKNYDLVITTGGLGPTQDDKTVEAVALAFEAKLVYHSEIEDKLYNFFRKKGLLMSELNKKQAYVPQGFNILQNEVGTAPGLLKIENKKILAIFPGVPLEMKEMFNNQFRSLLKQVYNLNQVYNKTITTMGIGESALADKLKEWEQGLPQGVKLAYLPSPGYVRLRLTSSDPSFDSSFLTNKFKKIIPLISKYIVALDDFKPEEVLSSFFKKVKLTLATAESCTGGALSASIVSIPGSSEFFKGSVVAYSNEIKQRILGVSSATLSKHGAVSEECVKEMAKGVVEKFASDLAVSISGIAGPEGGTEDKPVGTVWFCVYYDQHCFTKKLQLSNLREFNIKSSVNHAIYLIIDVLKQKFDILNHFD
jgi:nicotinamide-nucleotide amidase